MGAVELKRMATVSIVLYQNRSLTGPNPEQFHTTVAIKVADVDRPLDAPEWRRRFRIDCTPTLHCHLLLRGSSLVLPQNVEW